MRAGIWLLGILIGTACTTTQRVAMMGADELRGVSDAALCGGAAIRHSEQIDAEIERRNLISEDERGLIERGDIANGMGRCAIELVMDRRGWVLYRAIQSSTGKTDLVWVNKLGPYREFRITLGQDSRVVEWAE